MGRLYPLHTLIGWKADRLGWMLTSYWVLMWSGIQARLQAADHGSALPSPHHLPNHPYPIPTPTQSQSPSHPIPSHPIPSHPIQSINSPADQPTGHQPTATRQPTNHRLLPPPNAPALCRGSVRVGWRDRWAAWMRPTSPHGWVHGVSRQPTRTDPTRSTAAPPLQLQLQLQLHWQLPSLLLLKKPKRASAPPTPHPLAWNVTSS